MKSFLASIAVIAAAGLGFAGESAIPSPVTAAHFADLIERPPFRRFLSLSEALVLSGVARLPDGPVVTVWNRATGETFVVTAIPNPQGWRLVDLANSTDLRSVVATIAAAGQKVALRFDPDRLTPPKLDNQSKPGRRGELSLVVEALLRTLDPLAARSFDGMPAEAQEKFRKGFTEFLAAYPSSSDDKRIAFIHRSLAQAAGLREGGETQGPGETPKAPAPLAVPSSDQPKPPPATTPAATPVPTPAPTPEPAPTSEPAPPPTPEPTSNEIRRQP